MKSDSDERTTLLNNDRRYFKYKKRKAKQFQCLLCGIFILLFVVILVIIISKYINDGDSSDSPGTIPINEAFPVLFFVWPIQDKNISKSITSDGDLWRESEIAGEIALRDRDETEESSFRLEPGSPSYKHQKAFFTSEKSRMYSRIGYAKDYSTKYFYDKTNIRSSAVVCGKDVNHRLIYENFTNGDLKCQKEFSFRSYNGSCNNLLYPNDFGVSFQQFRRALPPDYADGINEPRKSSTGKDLPTARTVSNLVHRAIQRNDPNFTIMLTVWGQFIDHDITATALIKGSNDSSIACCVPNPHPECFPVILDESDPYYRSYNETCMEFIRSAGFPSSCLGPREQMTQTSAFLDGSVIYGPDEETAVNLRTLENGQLKMFKTKDNRTLLPFSEDPNDGCNQKEEMKRGRYCFMTGDSRANENLFLTSMHLIWVRHHNAIARTLVDLNPHWDDERGFQEARKIVGAQMQHITYNEFLPLIFGNSIMKETKLHLNKRGYSMDYNSSVNPTIANNFATSAFRFAHSLLPTLIKISASNGSEAQYLKLHQILFDPFQLYNSQDFDGSIKGAMETPIQANDPYFSEQLKQHLFQNQASNSCGLDLVSLNIQRGRDHGLPGYTKWRQHCGLKEVKSFPDLKNIFDEDSYTNIKKVYKNVNDIDLYTGALSERQLSEGILGPTFACLIVDQFVRLKVGDRFWYENRPPEGFTENQLAQIRKTTLAKVLCDNSDHVDSVPKHAMKRITELNKYLPCSNIPKLQLRYWKTNT